MDRILHKMESFTVSELGSRMNQRLSAVKVKGHFKQ